MSSPNSDVTRFPDYRLAQSTPIGTGGCCDGVERWLHIRDQKVYAAKRLSSERIAADMAPFNNELCALVAGKNVPRMVRLHKCLYGPGGDVYILLELLDGITLEDYLLSAHDCSESFTLTVAAQLLDSLGYMHVRAGLVHGDLSPSNIMLLNIGAGLSELRLFDFGCSRRFAPGKSSHQCIPDGHTIPYASPEVLTVKLTEITGEGETLEDYEVDSLAAEQWSAGVVLCEILIRQLPFESAAPLVLDCPAHLDSEASFLWAAHHNTLQAMQPWGDAVTLAETTGQPVQHPLADAIRRASKTPEQAVSFFASILHPDPAERSTASQAAAHPYLRTAISQISRDWLTPAASSALVSGEPQNALPSGKGLQDESEAAAIGSSVNHEAAQLNFDSSRQVVEESDDSGTYDSVVSVHSAEEELHADRLSPIKPSMVGKKHPLAAAAGALKHLGSGLKSFFGKPQQRAAAFDPAITLSPQPHDVTPSLATARSSWGQHSDPGLKSISAGHQSYSHAVSSHAPAATSVDAQLTSQVPLLRSARSPRLNKALFPSLPAITSSAAQQPQAFDPFILTPSTKQNPTSSSSVQYIARQSQAATATTSTKAEVQSKAQASRTVVQLTADCTAKPATKQTAPEGVVPAVPAVRRKKKASAVKQSKSKAADSLGATCFGKRAAVEASPVKAAPCNGVKKSQRRGKRGWCQKLCLWGAIVAGVGLLSRKCFKSGKCNACHDSQHVSGRGALHKTHVFIIFSFCCSTQPTASRPCYTVDRS